MTLALDFPAAHGSPIARFDPRWKLVAFLGSALVVAFLQNPLPCLVAWFASLGLLMFARVPADWYLGRVGWVLLFLGVFVIWLPFLPQPDEKLWRLGPITLGAESSQRALAILFRAATLLTLMLTLLASAPIEDLCKAAHSLYVPGLFVQILLLAYRYVFLLAEEFDRLRTALRVRGFRNRLNRASYRTIGKVAGTLLVRGGERAERVGQAMRCRGFDGQFRTMHDFRTRSWDLLFTLLMLATALGLFAWDRA